MAIYIAGQLVSQLRERTGLEREIILGSCGIDDSSLRRIENDKQHPSRTTLASLIENVKLPLEGFFYPLLDYQSMEVYLVCDQLNQALDRGDIAEAKVCLDQLDALPGYRSGICHQYRLSKHAHLLELMGKPSSQILPIIYEALIVTYENFSENDIGEITLILEEPELLHTLSRVYMRDGQLDAAIRILERMRSSYARMPESDKEKKKIFAPVLLSLAKCLLQTGDYHGALKACEMGAEFSAARRQGRFNPDFELITAHALRELGHGNECREHLQNAYFCYTLLGNMERARDVLKQAKELFDVTFELYGVDKLDFSLQPRIPYERGEAVECFSVGTMVSVLRMKAGLSHEQLCRGICDRNTLARIEQDKSSDQILTLEAILHRLGRDINLYVNFFLSKDEFTVMQLRERIDELLIGKQLNEVAALLNELSAIKSGSKHNINRQFIEMTRAILYAAESSGNNVSLRYRKMLLDALTITYPKFVETEIERYHLSFYEIALINLYASYCADAGNLSHAADIYARLHRNINARYYDEALKARFYSSILCNYSACLGRTDNYGKALQIISESDSFARRHGRLTVLPNLAFNSGYCLLNMGNINNSIPYLALSYYGSRLLSDYGNASILPVIQNYAAQYADVEFN